MEMEPVPGYKFANWELGYGDVHMVPDMGTLRLATWLDKTAFVCDVKSEKTHDYVDVAPRSILRRQIDAAKKAGYVGYAGTELEHYLFQTSYRQAAQQDFRNLEPAGWYLEDYHMLQGTRTEGFHARRAGTSNSRACRSRTRRANGARASTSSTCVSPRCSRWPTATSCSSSA